ncbi:hypothetical protein GALL_456010 [mine drainage metagenome]|uniref:Uncharacterized protein n=1 Tax=mine drainage metagenome TaxID=410659 RepID=A0A1J5PMJ9_9ZZZZ
MLGLVQIDQRPAIGGNLCHHRLEVGIFAAQRGNLARPRARIQPRFEKLETANDLLKFIHRNHEGLLPCPLACVKGLCPCSFFLG